MEKIITELQSIGFSALESSVYCTVIQNAGLTAYQISKTLGVSKSSIYNLVSGLVKKGALLQISGEPTRYLAEKPETLIQNLIQNFHERAQNALQELKKVTHAENDTRYINLEGWDAVLTRLKDLIASAQMEIILNIDFELNFCSQELKAAKDRGVRVLSFSFNDNKAQALGLETYSYMDNDHESPYRRIMIVVDFRRSLVANNQVEGIYIPHRSHHQNLGEPINFSGFTGVYSENPFLSQIVAEHIHQDIYMFKLRSRGTPELITPDIKLGTLMEKGFPST